jgi:hypothetical protein
MGSPGFDRVTHWLGETREVIDMLHELGSLHVIAPALTQAGIGSFAGDSLPLQSEISIDGQK